MYLDEDAKLLWITHMDDDESFGQPKIETWAMLNKELKDQFLPLNVAWLARDSLKNLKHKGTVHDYVKEFNFFMLDIKNMLKEDKLFNFISELQQWAHAELRRQCVKDLPSAIVAAEGLVDIKLSFNSSKNTNGVNPEKKKERTSKEGKKKGKYNKKGCDGSNKPQNDGNNQSKGGSSNTTKGCYICNGPHLMCDCPRKKD